MEDKIPIPHWKKALKPVLATVTPLVLLPMPLAINTDASWVGFLALWMCFYYVVEPVPLSVTSMLPIAVLPVIGVLSTEEVASFYLNNTGLLFMASLMIAAAIESSNLHERLAFKCLLAIGRSEASVMLGVMSITVLMSMWMPNTAVATIMGPIVITLSAKMALPSYHQVPPIECVKINGDGIGDGLEKPLEADESRLLKKDHNVLRRLMLLSVAYSSNIGGTGTIIGSSTNILFKGILDETFPHSTELTTATWMLYNVPPMIACTVIGWVYLRLMIKYERRKYRAALATRRDIRADIQPQYDKLGRVSFAECCVIAILTMLILLLFFFKPQFMRGWGDLLPHGGKMKSSSPALALCFLLFVLPKDPKNMHSSEPLVSFKHFSAKMPWGLVFLFGGCLSVAEASKRSGLSGIIISTMNGLRDLPSSLVLVLLCFAGCGLSEIVSTYVVTGIFTPIISELAVATRVHPLYYLMPVKACCLFAFMLPIATGGNAIISDMGKLRTVDMMKLGVVMNICCVLVHVASVNTLGGVVFDLHTFPSWAMRDFGLSSSLRNDTFENSTIIAAVPT